jgi:hypothetical protein
VTVTAPRVNDNCVDPDSVERQRFSSAILPAWARKSPQTTEPLAVLYLHGLSSGDFGPALEQFLGSGVSSTDYVCLWVDGIVRHEALCDRAGVEDPRRPVVVATG